jgi:hypothetical protein
VWVNALTGLGEGVLHFTCVRRLHTSGGIKLLTDQSWLKKYDNFVVHDAVPENTSCSCKGFPRRRSTESDTPTP